MATQIHVLPVEMLSEIYYLGGDTHQESELVMAVRGVGS